MRPKSIIIASIIFFFIVNTSYFWEIHLKGWDFVTTILLLIIYVVLLAILLIQIIILAKNKFRDIKRMVSTLILLFALLLIAAFPGGLLDFEEIIEEPDLLVARREGVANCSTYLKFKSANKFREKSFCFGSSEKKGKYQFNGDTIKIEFNNKDDNSTFAYGIIEKDKIDLYGNKGVLLYFSALSDSIPIEYTILKNDLK